MKNRWKTTRYDTVGEREQEQKTTRYDTIQFVWSKAVVKAPNVSECYLLFSALFGIVTERDKGVQRERDRSLEKASDLCFCWVTVLGSHLLPLSLNPQQQPGTTSRRPTRHRTLCFPCWRDAPWLQHVIVPSATAHRNRLTRLDSEWKQCGSRGESRSVVLE